MFVPSYIPLYTGFARNQHVMRFDGPDRCKQDRSSGLFNGTMVVHSIAKDGIGFPYFSPTCYWYKADGEERELEYVSVADIGADVASVIRKVHQSGKHYNNSCIYNLCSVFTAL